MRAQSIGVCPLVGRWSYGAHLFATPLDAPYVNVVCAPFGYMMGERVTAAQMARSDNCPPALRAIMAEKEGPGDEFVYEPQDALCGLYTVGCKNIAIISAASGVPSEREVACMRKYDAIICPTAADYWTIVNLDLPARHIEPTAKALTELLGELCGSVITATSDDEQGMPELPTIISALSRRTQTWNSKSSRSEKMRLLRRRRSALLRLQRSRSFRGRISRTLRSIIRSLAFWRRWTGRKPRPPSA